MVQFNDIAALILNLLPTGQQITAANHRTVETAILTFAKEQWLPGDIKMIDCTKVYIDANFVTSGPTQGRGLPGGERDGWAICNGLNTTKNRCGRVSVGYDYNRTLFDSGLPNGIGETGGAEKHPLSITEMPSHNHTRAKGNDNNLGGGANQFGWQAIDDLFGSYATSNTGGGQSHNNMQPYIVTLFIQKL